MYQLKAILGGPAFGHVLQLLRKAMKFLLIPDKFKGSLSADEVIGAMKEGILSALPDSECFGVLASDGGDGFLDAIAKYRTTEQIVHDTTDPLGRPIQAHYLFNGESSEAYVELVQAAGLVLLDEGERSAIQTSTYGTGLQIGHAIAKGAKTVYIGLGGSATTDGGTGIARALGYRFLDSSGKELEAKGGNLLKMVSIDATNAGDLKNRVSLIAVCDVDNPLYGPGGAAYVYAGQKGASQRDIEMLDRGLRHLDALVAGQLGKKPAHIPGAGAAGGTSYGLKAFFDAEFLGGTSFILQMAGIRELLDDHSIDYILTGEGKIDSQTLSGKLISGIIDLGRQFNIPVIAACGKLGIPLQEIKAAGVKDVIEVSKRGKSLQYNMTYAAPLLKEAVRHYFQK